MAGNDAENFGIIPGKTGMVGRGRLPNIWHLLGSSTGREKGLPVTCSPP